MESEFLKKVLRYSLEKGSASIPIIRVSQINALIRSNIIPIHSQIILFPLFGRFTIIIRLIIYRD